MLSRRAGVQYIEAVEDAVQSALMAGLETWTVAGLPDNPSAWLFRVAHNHLMGELRQRTAHRHRIRLGRSIWANHRHAEFHARFSCP